MKQFWAISILCALLLALFSCREEAVSPRLAEIDALLRTDPDSAYSLLCDSTSTPLAGRRDSAMWRLLTAEARDKTFHDDTVPGEIRRASAYFRDRGDRKNLMRSLFYEGRILQNAGLHGEAVVTLLQSAEQADTTADRLYLGKIYNAIGEIYQSIGDSPQEAEYFEKAWKAYQKTDSAVFIDEAQSCYGLALCRSGRCDAGIRLMTEAYNSAKKLGDTITLHLTLSNLAIGYLWADRNVPGRDCLSIIYANRQSMPMAPEYLDLFLYSLIQTNAPNDSIEMVAKDLLQTAQKWKICYEYYINKNNFEYAFYSLRDELKENEIIFKKRLHNNINSTLNAFNLNRTNKLKQETEMLRQHNTWLIIVSILVAALTISITYILHIRRTKKTANLLNTIELLTIEWNRISEELKNSEATIDKLTHENTLLANKTEGEEAAMLMLGIFAELNNLYFQRYMKEGSDKERKATINLMEGQIKLLREDPTILRCMEKYVDLIYDNILEDVYTTIKLMPNQYRIIALLCLNFSREAICRIFDITLNSYYTRMNRLVTRLNSSSSPRKDELIALIKQKSSNN